MELADGQSVLGRTVQSWGYKTVEDFARERAKNILQQKIAYYQSQIDLFEQKYGLDFSNFYQQFDSIQHHNLFEKKDDSLRWKTALDVLKSYQSELFLLAA